MPGAELRRSCVLRQALCGYPGVSTHQMGYTPLPTTAANVTAHGGK